MKWQEWSPEGRSHIKGRYTTREVDPRTGLWDPQEVRVTCTVCGDEWRTQCASGRVREHIVRFGVVHAHVDPFKR